ncbi:hypothetical protein [Aedoeadaptatus coli]|uniref:hypothetical protein n=1 Tax=Aedoeadaptatus coli TaxID=2058292 RepID=UPI000D554644|nr:hypothetical protein [Peptoniphilus coli]
MKEWKTTLLLIAEYFIVLLAVNYFVSKWLYGHWQFRDFYTNIYYWIFLGAAFFFKILFSAIRNHFKKSDTGKKS